MRPCLSQAGRATEVWTRRCCCRPAALPSSGDDGMPPGDYGERRERVLRVNGVRLWGIGKTQKGGEQCDWRATSRAAG